MPKPVLELTGKRFSLLTVIKRVFNTGKRGSRWLCKCDCGNEKIVSGYDINCGNVQSCGCLLKTNGFFMPPLGDENW